MSMGKKNSTKSRSRNNERRKQKFLSLSLELNSEKKSQPLDQMPHVSSTTASTTHEENQQLNLFPLHPENLVDHEKEENNVALFFSGTENTETATTLTGLLTCSKDDGDSTNGFDYMTTVSTSEASLSYADTYHGQQGALVRTALRNKERDNREEEKWVDYSDVVDVDQHSETRKDEEVSSCSIDHPRKRDYYHQHKNLSLKLDYEEILNAWSDKGSLYLHSESPQIVPDIHDDFLANCDMPFSSQGLMYRVPEVMASEGRIRENLQEEELKVGRSREATVLRYKEKRQNRLFAKRIRYEVRKLNAEKRPRVKGRFVKRS